MKRSLLFISFFILVGLSFARPVFAEGCCVGPTAAYFLFDNNQCLNEASPPGRWDAHQYPDSITGKCELMVGADERALVIGKSIATQVAEKPPLIFIPSVEIPGLFTGPIVVGNETLGQYIAAFYMFFVGLTGVLAMAMLVYSGFRRITAAGNSSKVQESTDIMNAALSGVVLVMLSYLLLNLINPALTRLAGMQLDPIKPVLFSFESSAHSLRDASVCGVGVNPATGELVGFQDDIYEYDDIFKEVGDAKGVMPSLLKAIMIVESCGDPDAASVLEDGTNGGCGLMQVNPKNNTTGGSGCDGLRTPAIEPTDSDAVKEAKLKIIKANITRGAEIIVHAYKKTCPETARYESGEVVQCDHQKSGCIVGADRYAIAAYNGGTGANCNSSDCQGETWWECKNNDGFAATRQYVSSIVAAHNMIRNRNWIPD
ncbi:MAG: transglycosylase SLT domain-containing protein [Patescibacteria group bacterium]|jgi:hypothetical protein